MSARRKIWLSSPHMGGDELKFIKQAFDENWVAPVGPQIDGFENDLAAYLGNDVHVAALQSGTAAMHLALLLLGVKRGDEVICQSFTFAASANPITYVGATPVFVDSETETWNMDAALLEAAIRSRLAAGVKPAAIIVVHLYGMPANMREIMHVAEQYQVPVIEDAAEALGSTYNARPAGTFGQIAVLSFNGNKIITTSGGGALVSRQSQLVNQCRFLATQARDDAPHYEHSVIGYNYRISNICAAIGRGQMMALGQRVQERRKVFDHYRRNLHDGGVVKFHEEPGEQYFSNRWLTTILLPDFATRERIRLALQANNIDSRPLWKPMHLQPVYKECKYVGNGVSDNLFERGLCLPSGSNLTDEDLEFVVGCVKSAI